MQQRRDAALRGLRSLLVACVVLPVASFSYAAWWHYDAAWRTADDRIEAALDISAEQATRVFQSIAVILDSVDQIANARSDDDIRNDQARLHERLKQLIRGLPDAASVWILDHNGDTLVTSLFYPLPPAINGPERAYLKSQLAPGRGIFTGEAVKIGLTGNVIFPVSRRRYMLGDTLLGYTLVSVNPKAFETFYAPLAARTSASFALIRDEGAILARYPDPPAVGIKLDPTTGFGKTIAANPAGGKYTTVSGVDKRERRFSVRKLNGLPLYISSSLETRGIVEGWLWTMAGHLIFGVPATLLLIALIWLSMKRTQELYAEATRREAAETSLRHVQKMEAIGQLTGGIAHDFNNLLMVIIGNIQMALRQLPEGRPRTLVSNAQRGAERAAQLTKRLLAFARNQPLAPKPLDLNSLVSGLGDLLERTLGEAVAIETVRGGGLWRTEADEAELESAVLNLAINARDAMPGGGKLTVETANAFLDDHYCKAVQGVEPGQYVMLSVTDNGSGIPKKVLDQVFEPFFTTKKTGAGTGLGLSQVYGFVKQSGGHIRIYSEVGEGTTVKIYLPRCFNSDDAPTIVAENSLPIGNGESLLVVEDDPAVRAHVVETLEELSYKVHQAVDGSTGLSLLKTTVHVDLVITDVVMPGMSGREFADQACMLRPALRVIYMTGYSRNAIVHQGRLDPGVSLLQKPFTREALARMITLVLGKKEVD